MPNLFSIDVSPRGERSISQIMLSSTLVMSVDKEAFKTEPVERAEFRALDRKNAWRIISIGFGIALAATLLAYFL